MGSTTRKRFCIVALATLLLFPGTIPAQVTIAQNANQLAQQYSAHHRAGRYRQAEAVARQGLVIAERSSDQKSTAYWLNELALACQNQGRYAEAEPLYKRSLAIGEKVLGPEHPDVATRLHNLASLYENQGRYAEAEPLYKRSLAIREKVLGPENANVAASLNNLADLYENQGRYVEAEPLYKRSLAIREKVLGPEHPDVATSLNNLANLYDNQGRYAEAEPLYKRALAIREKVLGPEHPDVAMSLNNLASLYWTQGRYAEAEPLYKRAFAINEKVLGPEHRAVAYNLNNLALLYRDQGRYAEAEPLDKRALAIREKILGPEHREVAVSLNNLALLYEDQGRYAEAEPLDKRALAIREKILGPEHPDVAYSLVDLASLYSDQGRYAEAEPLYKRSLAIREKVLGPEHSDVATSLHNLARLYENQGRYAEAEPLCKRALAIWEKVLGPEHPYVASSLNNLALLYCHQGGYAEAEPLYKRALAIDERVHGPEHRNVATNLNNLADLCRDQGRYVEAEPLYKRALAIRERVLGPEHPDVANSLKNLAHLYRNRGRDAEAEELVDRAIRILERTRAAPDLQFKCLTLRAELAWKAGRRGEALADLHRAMELAESLRGQASGAEQERAEFFSQFSAAFEQMVAWQSEIGDTGEAISAIERGRARSLLDELNLAGADLDLGRPAVEREARRQQENEIKGRIARLEKELSRLAGATGKAKPDGADEPRKLETALAEARGELYEQYRQARSTSPVYRNLLSVGAGPPRLRQLQRRLLAGDGLMLVYLLGQKGGYVLVLGPNAARLVELKLDKTAAKTLGVEAGALTAKRLGATLVNKQSSGVVQQLSDPKPTSGAGTKLAALWQVLVPEAEREALIKGQYKRLIVVPDGPLSLLPFEALVVEAGEKPKYLLDVGPPILYAPSATVLYNLAERPAKKPSELDLKPVLSVGDPAYEGPTSVQVASAGRSVLNELAPGSRYAARGGRLTSLPYSGVETNWVADAFRKAGVAVGRLEKQEATEANVRYNVPGRRIVHLACHGLADQRYGNFFGALALAPGPRAASDPADDGYLTLPEIYELDLKSCELAILSACETNYGPEQKGEGVWALSRGFLVAGARRVVASNWLVDDEAAASLVSYFCSGLAKAEGKGKTPDHAQTLQAAKRWVRQQDKWRSPYYWASFVLVGPD